MDNPVPFRLASQSNRPQFKLTHLWLLFSNPRCEVLQANRLPPSLHSQTTDDINPRAIALVQQLAKKVGPDEEPGFRS